MHSVVYIGIGSNLGNRKYYIRKALELLKVRVEITACSHVYRTKPYGLLSQPDFLNMVIEGTTVLSPYELLNFLHKIESDLGRERKIHWGPRTIDLDILFYDNMILNEEKLVIPHPDLHNRYFVLKPLSDINSELTHPIFGVKIKELLKNIEKKNN